MTALQLNRVTVLKSKLMGTRSSSNSFINHFVLMRDKMNSIEICASPIAAAAQFHSVPSPRRGNSPHIPLINHLTHGPLLKTSELWSRECERRPLRLIYANSSVWSGLGICSVSIPFTQPKRYTSQGVLHGTESEHNRQPNKRTTKYIFTQLCRMRIQLIDTLLMYFKVSACSQWNNKILWTVTNLNDI